MSESELRQEIKRIILKNGKVTKKYLFDIFINYPLKESYKRISRYAIEEGLNYLLYKERLVFKVMLGRTVLYSLK